MPFSETDAAPVPCYQTAMAKPKPAHLTSDIAQAAIASALRTLEAEGSGIDALAAALRDGLGSTFAAAIELIRATQGLSLIHI